MAKVDLSDAEIAVLIAVPKVIPSNFSKLTKLKPRHGHGEAQFEITTSERHRFRFILRQSHYNILDFSAILGYTLPSSARLFLLRRYNGKSHEHTNTIEAETFYDYHIHMATERYQAKGFNEERYAVVTNRYVTLRQAFDCLMADCNVTIQEEELQHYTLFR